MQNSEQIIVNDTDIDFQPQTFGPFGNFIGLCLISCIIAFCVFYGDKLDLPNTVEIRTDKFHGNTVEIHPDKLHGKKSYFNTTVFHMQLNDSQFTTFDVDNICNSSFIEPVSNTNHKISKLISAELSKFPNTPHNELYPMSQYVVLHRMTVFEPEKVTARETMEPSLLFDERYKIFYAMWRKLGSRNQLIFGIYDATLRHKLLIPEKTIEVLTTRHPCNESPRLFFMPNRDVGISLECSGILAIANISSILKITKTKNQSFAFTLAAKLHDDKNLYICNNIFPGRHHKNWAFFVYNDHIFALERIEPLEILQCKLSNILHTCDCELIYHEILPKKHINNNEPDFLRGASNLIQIPQYAIDDIIKRIKRSDWNLFVSAYVNFFVGFIHSNSKGAILHTPGDTNLYETMLILIRMVDDPNKQNMHWDVIDISDPLTFHCSNDDTIAMKYAYIEQTTKGLARWEIWKTKDERWNDRMWVSVMFRNISKHSKHYDIRNIELSGIIRYIRNGLINTFSVLHVSNDLNQRWFDTFSKYFNKYN
eukprot:371466_1